MADTKKQTDLKVVLGGLSLCLLAFCCLAALLLFLYVYDKYQESKQQKVANQLEYQQKNFEMVINSQNQ